MDWGGIGKIIPGLESQAKVLNKVGAGGLSIYK